MKRTKKKPLRQRNPVVRALSRHRAGGSGRHKDKRGAQRERIARQAMRATISGD